MKTVSIYVLRDPDTKKVHYVGRTTSTESARLGQHINRRDSSERSAWVQSVIARGQKPTLEIVDKVPENQGQKAEIGWIVFFYSRGHPLTNSQKGFPKRQNISQSAL